MTVGEDCDGTTPVEKVEVVDESRIVGGIVVPIGREQELAGWRRISMFPHDESLRGFLD
jgi:hypothetical protein